MKVRIYFDVHGYEKEPSEIYPTTTPSKRMDGVKRYCVEVEIEDPYQPDEVKKEEALPVD